MRIILGQKWRIRSCLIQIFYYTKLQGTKTDNIITIQLLVLAHLHSHIIVKPPITATSPQPPPLYNDHFLLSQGAHCGEVQLYLYRSLAQKFFPKCLPWNP